MPRGVTPAKRKAEGRPPVVRKPRKAADPKTDDLDKRLADALAHQAATSEVLRVISASPTDVQPVLDTVAEHAARLCKAQFARVFLIDGDMLRTMADYAAGGASVIPARLVPLKRTSITGRAILERATIHHGDVRPLLDTEFPDARENVELIGCRSVLAVPLMRDEAAFGAIFLWRRESGRFAPDQVELVQTFARQVSIAVDNVRLFNETKEALEQQTATSEILRAISSSPTEIQPVLEAVVHAAARFCAAPNVLLLRLEGDVLRGAASVGRYGEIVTERIGSVAALEVPATRGSVSGRAVLDRRTIHVHDLATEDENEYPTGRELQRQFGNRTVLVTPLLREGVPLGAIGLFRMEVKPFSDNQVELLKTFADQAVIAIENVRLFKEVEARNRDLTEALEQQTATSEILRVISQSPRDVQPVFDTIATAALELCAASVANVVTLGGGMLYLQAYANLSPEGAEALERSWPQPVDRGTAAGRAVQSAKVVVIPDVLEDGAYAIGASASTTGFRSVVSVPLVRDGIPIGAINVGRHDPGPLPDKQIALLRTFADQAVIAIENVRLFTELDARNRDIMEALEQQTATSEILRVISKSPTDVQPVFDTIAGAVIKLCSAELSVVSRVDGELIHLVALRGVTPEGTAAIGRHFPMRMDAGTVTARTVRNCAAVHVPDAWAEPDYESEDAARVGNYRGCLGVPMLRDGRVIGAIFVGRHSPGHFTGTQVALLQTFADQAVIAIENVRLFTELQVRTTDLTQSVGELKALGEVGQAVSSTLDLDTVLRTIVSRATQLSGMDGGAIYEYDETHQQFYLRTAENYPDALVDALRSMPVRKGEGAVGQLAVTYEPVEIRDIADDPNYQSRVREILIRLGYRSLLAVPLLREDKLLGGLVVNRKRSGEFAPQVIDLLKTFASQSALAIQNARLFREIEDKSRQLEVASQHKSEFLANMSHELRTPLNAIIGFSEVLSERMFGEVNDKQAEYLADILESGRHLLSLINDILDLSKIEAGRMELDLSEFQLPAAIENTLTLVRERAHRRGITLEREIDAHVGAIRADERKVKQVLLNLLSNALKFTPEGGRIDVRAVMLDGVVEISVTDTGVGIAPDDQATVFEEFRQVGATAKKVEGTGLGLAISRKFIELHGGRISVKSEVGVGSTFGFTLPSAGPPPRTSD